MSYIDDIKKLAETTSMTNREIAETLGCSRRTVRRVAGPQSKRKGVDDIRMPRILLFDIETLPMECYIWQLFKNVVMPHQMIKDWSMLTWSAKWLFEDTIMSDSVSGAEAVDREDLSILVTLWSLLDQADIVIAHGAHRFDIPRSNARFMHYGMMPPSPYQVIDTLTSLKKVSWPSSYKLEFINKFLQLEQLKGSSNFGMWKRAAKGDDKAIEEMLVYNQQDVVALEDLYLRIRPWIKSHPNVGTYLESDEPVCPNCGNENLIWNGSYHTPAGRYQAFRCENCGAIGRSRFSDLDKESRKLLCLSAAR